MTYRYSTDEDYDAMKDDYLTGDYDLPVTRRQRRQYEDDQSHFEENEGRYVTP